MPVTRPSQVARAALQLDFTFDLVGDSRASIGSTASGYATTSSQFFNQANCLAGHRYQLGTNYGVSGNRSDQYVLSAIAAGILTSPSGFVLWFFPAVNDISQAVAGYTNTIDGTAVTTSNVGASCMNNIIYLASRLAALGKKLILCLEPGSTTFSTASIAAMYDLNLRITGYANATPGMYPFNANDVVWNNTSSATTIAFKTGYSVDGTHYTTLGAFAAGVAFNTFIQTTFAVADLAIASINAVQTTDPRSLVNNPLFNTASGGTISGNSSVNGNVPSGWTFVGGSSQTIVTITSSAEANGNGNAITIAITTATSDSLRFQSNAPSNANYTLAQWMQGGADVAVASGANNIATQFSLENVTNLANSQQYDLINTAGPGPSSVAYTYRFQSLLKPVTPGSTTQSFLIAARIWFISTGASSGTFTVTRAWGGPGHSYNQLTGFSA